MAKKLYLYPGQDVDVTWHRPLCIHVGECGRADNELFVTGRDPWCQPDVSNRDDIAEVVDRCPTGALTYADKSNVIVEQPAAENTITVSQHGPLYARGDLDIDGADADHTGAKFRAALCRCGRSKNKPFCDNAHEGDDDNAPFKDRGAVGQAGDGHDEIGGPLKVGRAPNGPLLLDGNFSIISGAGRRTFRGTKAALCRCGQSKNKPFCDGAHKAAGFSAE